MTLDEVLALIIDGNMGRCMSVFEQHCLIKDITESIKQYDPMWHDIRDESKRPDKMLYDDKGAFTGKVTVAKLPVPIQKKIVLLAASFLGNPEVDCRPANTDEENMLSAILKTWEDNKLDYKFKNIAKKTMSQRQAAELWYLDDAGPDYWQDETFSSKKKLKMRILSHCAGDTLYPVFDTFNDLIAFGRSYTIRNVDDKLVTHFDVYTADEIYMSMSEGAGWLFGAPAENSIVYSEGVKSIKNTIGKIPVIYYHQPFTEWHDVQPLIERLEIIISNLADTNDYSGSPIVLAMGEVVGFSAKGEQGKVLELKNGADVKYLTYDSAPESIKMEIEGLLKYIYTFTHTPDISFEQMKGLGVFSGIALKMLFLDAHLKAADKEELFGECLQRRFNYLKAALAVIDSDLKTAVSMKIKPKFKYFLPENIVEEIDNLVKAKTAGLMSNETAITLNPLVGDAEAEIVAIGSEQDAADAKSLDKAAKMAAVTGPTTFA